MTAVAVQQQAHAAHRQYNPRQSPHSSNMSSPHQSQSQSYSSASAAQGRRQEPPTQNGNSSGMSARHAVSNDPVQVANGSRSENGEGGEANGRTSSSASNAVGERRSSMQTRPTSAPNGAGETSQEDSEPDGIKRRPKPLLQRAKSDFGPRGEDQDAQAEEDIQDWGARHGFEDHYASEEYVSQLANVSCSCLSCSFLEVYFAARTRVPAVPVSLHPS